MQEYKEYSTGLESIKYASLGVLGTGGIIGVDAVPLLQADLLSGLQLLPFHLRLVPAKQKLHVEIIRLL